MRENEMNSASTSEVTTIPSPKMIHLAAVDWLNNLIERCDSEEHSQAVAEACAVMLLSHGVSSSPTLFEIAESESRRTGNDKWFVDQIRKHTQPLMALVGNEAKAMVEERLESQMQSSRN